MEITVVDDADRPDGALAPWLRARGFDVPGSSPGKLGAVEIVDLVLTGAGTLASLVSAVAGFAQARRRTIRLRSGDTEVEVDGTLSADELARIVERLEDRSD